MCHSIYGVSGAFSPSVEVLGASRLAAGTGNGIRGREPAPDLVLCLALVVQSVGEFETSVASSPVTMPIRPPLATSQIDMPPQWSLGLGQSEVVGEVGPALRLRHPCRDLGAVTYRELRPASLPMFTRGLTWTQNLPGGPV